MIAWKGEEKDACRPRGMLNGLGKGKPRISSSLHESLWSCASSRASFATAPNGMTGMLLWNILAYVHKFTVKKCRVARVSSFSSIYFSCYVIYYGEVCGLKAQRMFFFAFFMLAFPSVLFGIRRPVLSYRRLKPFLVFVRVRWVKKGNKKSKTLRVCVVRRLFIISSCARTWWVLLWRIFCWIRWVRVIAWFGEVVCIVYTFSIFLLVWDCIKSKYTFILILIQQSVLFL